MKPSPYQITAFTHAARERSFSRAAGALGVTQSSITQHVAKLEALMGVQLFVRRREGLELTRAGRDLFELSDRLRTMEEIVAERVASYGSMGAGELRIIANCPRPAMPVIARFVALYPEVQIEFGLHRWDEAMRRMREREADIGVITEPDRLPALHCREIEVTRYLAVMRHDHRLAGRRRLSLRELAAERLVLPEDGSFTQRVVQATAREAGVRLSRVLKTWTFPVVKEAILHGAGIGIALENSLFPSRHLVEIPIDEMAGAYRNYLVTPADKRELRAVRSFFDVAAETDISAGADPEYAL
ncbi:MAG: LysR family transcriptional regulator [Pseudomonadota bacterium]